MKRFEYAGSVHDEEEIEAVVAVLRGGPTALRIAPGGLANADRVMATGLIPPCNHAIDDEGVEYICHHAREFLERAA